MTHTIHGRTKKDLFHGLQSLLETKPFSKITVREISDISGVHRNTFYSHFYNKDELLATFLEEQITNSPTYTLERVLETPFTCIYDAYNQLEKVFKRQSDDPIFLKTVTSAFLSPLQKEPQVEIDHYLQLGKFSGILWWLNQPEIHLDMLKDHTLLDNIFKNEKLPENFRNNPDYFSNTIKRH